MPLKMLVDDIYAAVLTEANLLVYRFLDLARTET